MNTRKKKVKKIKITLADLHETIDKSFGKLENKISQEVGGLKEEMNSRFDEVDKRFEEVLNTQDSILKRLDNLETDKIMDMAFRDRVEKLENDVEKIKFKLGLNKNQA